MYAWQCQKPQKLGVGMVVRRQDRACKDYTSTPSLLLVSVVSSTAIPTSLYIFRKCCSYLYKLFLMFPLAENLRYMIDSIVFVTL